ncbi:unnamed protein product [Effrenium voratum]|nr:unnamed protein product [Effrenium voratum]
MFFQIPGPPETEIMGEESDYLIEDFREHHSESSVHFEITLSAAKLKEAEKAGLEKTFKLKSSISTSNMVLFDAEGKIAKYNSSLDILQEFCKLRTERCDSPVTTTSWEDVTSAAKEDFKSDLQQKPVKPDMTPVKETTLQTDKTKLLEAIKQTYGKSTAESITAILAQDEDEKPEPPKKKPKADEKIKQSPLQFKQNAEPHKRERSRSASHSRYASLQKNGDEEEDEDEKQG